MRIPGPLLEARFLERPNRFLATVELHGDVVESHLPDPGRLSALLVRGRRVWVRPEHARNRKTGHTLVLVEATDGELVSVVTTLPNQLVEEALREGRISELAGLAILQREYGWGRSRFDFLLGAPTEERMLLEVKSVTWVEGDRALFPDAVTARGARHLRELAKARRAGLRSGVVFVVQRRDAESVSAARARDPAFATALESAVSEGVEVYGYRCAVSRVEARLTAPLRVRIG